MLKSVVTPFQSHNGAIAARHGYALRPTPLKRFNPTMVRLLPSLIASHILKSLSFNPTMVRLLPEVIYELKREFRKVSIPQWCDCCGNADGSTESNHWFQSHNGAIAAGKDAWRN